MQPSTVGRPRRLSRGVRWILVGVITLIAVAGAIVAHRRWKTAHELPIGLLQVNGRIEGDAVMVGSKLAGRVCQLRVREGDTVRAGQMVAALDDDVARARLAQAVAARDAATAQADAARAELGLLLKQVPITIDSASAALSGNDATLEQARAQEAQLGREAARTRTLHETGAVDEETSERASLAHETARLSLAAARAARARGQDSLLAARLGPEQVRAKQAQIAALDAAARQAQAAITEAQSAVDDLTIVAPVSGTVTARFIDVGEIVSPGTPLVELVDLDRLYLRAFVADADIGKVRLDAMARVYTDAFPDQPFAARVRYIASRAEFTPKGVQTRDERVKLVYAVKLYLEDNGGRRVSPGLTADAVVRWREGVPWRPPQ